MDRHHHRSLRCLALLATAAVVAGCGDSNKPPAYGTPMASSPAPSTDAGPSTVAPTGIPAGARLLCQGTYDHLQFLVPKGDGLLYVYDLDAAKVVGKTNAVVASSGRLMTMADLGNVSQGLSQTDVFQIFFAPSAPTTQPIGGT